MHPDHFNRKPNSLLTQPVLFFLLPNYGTSWRLRVEQAIGHNDWWIGSLVNEYCLLRFGKRLRFGPVFRKSISCLPFLSPAKFFSNIWKISLAYGAKLKYVFDGSVVKCWSKYSSLTCLSTCFSHPIEMNNADSSTGICESRNRTFNQIHPGWRYTLRPRIEIATSRKTGASSFSTIYWRPAVNQLFFAKHFGQWNLPTYPTDFRTKYNIHPANLSAWNAEWWNFCWM